MVIKIIVNEKCPCKKAKCEFHGKCDECRKHHADSKRQRPCERKATGLKKIISR